MKLKIRALQNYTLFKMLTSKGQYQVIKKKKTLESENMIIIITIIF